MALIGTIRKNSWILIALMTLALGGFVLMDIISNIQRYDQGGANTVGKVNGKEIDYRRFSEYERTVYPNARDNAYQIRQQIWDYFVENELVSAEAEKIGLGISPDELSDLQYGDNLSPIITGRLSGGTGQVDRQVLAQYKQADEQNQWPSVELAKYWTVQKDEIAKERLEGKIISLASKSIFAPTWQAEMAHRESNEKIDYAQVRIPYDKVKDDEIKVEDADYTNYLKLNPKVHALTEESRIVDYFYFDVRPTSSDSATARAAVAKMADGLRNAKNDSIYAVTNNGVYDQTYKAKSTLPPASADSLLNRPVGSVVGPYLDGGVWTTAKILDRKVMPDSVKARHILRQGNTPASKKTIDSLLALLNNGQARFDSLAARFSTDRSNSAKGGDLGWFAQGMMVPEFNNLCFNKAEQGKYYSVATQFGWHLVEVTGKKFVKNEPSVRAIYLSQAVEPSKETQQAVRDKALALIQQVKTLEELTTKAQEQGLAPQSSPLLKPNDYSLGVLGAGDAVRNIIQWAFNEKTKAGNISKEVFSLRDPNGGFFDSKYVLAGVKSIFPVGEPSVVAMKEMQDVVFKVKNLKKAEVLKGKIQNSTDLNALAQQFEARVDTMKSAGMQFSMGEPRVIGTVFSAAKGSVSAPIVGNNGVYVVQPLTDRTPAPPLPADLTLLRRQATSMTSNAIRMNLLNSMKKGADLKDNRSRFF